MPADSPAPAAGPSPAGGFAAGVRAGVGPATASFVLAVAFGAAARSYGWGVVAPIACSMLVFSGSAQFAMATALTGGGGALGGIVAGALVTTRFIPMGVGLAPSLVGGRGRRALEAQAIVDPSWLAAHVGGGRFDRRLLLGASSVQWPCWVVGTAIGVLAAPPDDLFRALGLDVVFPAFFLILLLDELRRSRRARIAAGLATAIAGSLVLVAPVGLALIGSGAAAGLGLLPGGAGEDEDAGASHHEPRAPGTPDATPRAPAAPGAAQASGDVPTPDAAPADGQDTVGRDGHG